MNLQAICKKPYLLLSILSTAPLCLCLVTERRHRVMNVVFVLHLFPNIDYNKPETSYRGFQNGTNICWKHPEKRMHFSTSADNFPSLFKLPAVASDFWSIFSFWGWSSTKCFHAQRKFIQEFGFTLVRCQRISRSQNWMCLWFSFFFANNKSFLFDTGKGR